MSTASLKMLMKVFCFIVVVWFVVSSFNLSAWQPVQFIVAKEFTGDAKLKFRPSAYSYFLPSRKRFLIPEDLNEKICSSNPYDSFVSTTAVFADGSQLSVCFQSDIMKSPDDDTVRLYIISLGEKEIKLFVGKKQDALDSLKRHGKSLVSGSMN